MEIVILDYQPAWANQFELLKAVYQSRLGGLVAQVEHVGSTAVPGLAAKPVLDIDLIAENPQMLPAITTALEKLGYGPRGELGIAGRFAFARLTGSAPEDGTDRLWPAHHLYVCVRGSIALRNHLLFRDALRGDAALTGRYAALKHALAATSGNMDAYVRGKTAFITSVLEDAGMGGEALEEVVRANAVK